MVSVSWTVCVSGTPAPVAKLWARLRAASAWISPMAPRSSSALDSRRRRRGGGSDAVEAVAGDGVDGEGDDEELGSEDATGAPDGSEARLRFASSLDSAGSDVFVDWLPLAVYSDTEAFEDNPWLFDAFCGDVIARFPPSKCSDGSKATDGRREFAVSSCAA